MTAWFLEALPARDVDEVPVVVVADHALEVTGLDLERRAAGLVLPVGLGGLLGARGRRQRERAQERGEAETDHEGPP